MKSIEQYYELAIECKLLSEYDVKYLMQKAIEIFVKEPNVKYINASVTVVGDIHGQFFDLKELFSVGGELPYTNYLFLGDYVDRGNSFYRNYYLGPYSIEVIVLLIILKIRYPSKIHLIRGNHESKQTSSVFNPSLIINL